MIYEYTLKRIEGHSATQLILRYFSSEKFLPMPKMQSHTPTTAASVGLRSSARFHFNLSIVFVEVKARRRSLFIFQVSVKPV